MISFIASLLATFTPLSPPESPPPTPTPEPAEEFAELVIADPQQPSLKALSKDDILKIFLHAITHPEDKKKTAGYCSFVSNLTNCFSLLLASVGAS